MYSKILQLTSFTGINFNYWEEKGWFLEVLAAATQVGTGRVGDGQGLGVGGWDLPGGGGILTPQVY